MPFRPRGSAISGFGLAAVVLLTGGLFTACDRQAPESLAQSEMPIIGGKLDTSHKGVVSLLKQVQGGFYPACSGTLLTQNLVLTAHHCVASLNSADGASVECGKTQFKGTESASSMIVSIEANVGNEGLDPFRVAEVWVPPGSPDVCGRDIALLLLSGSGVPASQATPIEPALSKELAANEVFAAIGFGLQDPADQTGETAGHRMGVSNAKVFCDGAACGTSMVLDGEFIADSPVCSGDSGGPALDKDGRVSGVTSRGDDKCTVGIYSSVSAWSDFIIEKTFVAAESGHYNPPTWAGSPPPGFDPGVPATGGSSSTGSGGTGTSTAGSGGSITLAGSGPSSGGGSANASGGSGTTSPTINPLGLSCNGDCPGSYKCWANTGKPPGICVPECSATQTTCPEGYTCDMQLNACIKPAATTTQSGGCSIAVAPGSTRSEVWLVLAALGLVGVGRRARRRASGT